MSRHNLWNEIATTLCQTQRVCHGLVSVVEGNVSPACFYCADQELPLFVAVEDLHQFIFSVAFVYQTSLVAGEDTPRASVEYTLCIQL